MQAVERPVVVERYEIKEIHYAKACVDIACASQKAGMQDSGCRCLPVSEKSHRKHRRSFPSVRACLHLDPLEEKWRACFFGGAEGQSESGERVFLAYDELESMSAAALILLDAEGGEILNYVLGEVETEGDSRRILDVEEDVSLPFTILDTGEETGFSLRFKDGDTAAMRESEGVEDPELNGEAVLYRSALVYDAYKYDVNTIVPNMPYTEEQSKKISEYTVSVGAYANSATIRFITGDMNVETDWDTYLSEMQKMDLDGYIAVMQEAYDTYSAAMAK